MASARCSSFVPTSSHCFVDETLRFNSLENAKPAHDTEVLDTTVDTTTYLPLDENYTSCQSVLNNENELPLEMFPHKKNVRVS